MKKLFYIDITYKYQWILPMDGISEMAYQHSNGLTANSDHVYDIRSLISLKRYKTLFDHIYFRIIDINDIYKILDEDDIGDFILTYMVDMYECFNIGLYELILLTINRHNYSVFKKLISHGVNIHFAPITYYLPFIHTCRKWYPDMMDLFIENGAIDLEYTDMNRDSCINIISLDKPTDVICKEDQYDVINYLLYAGARIYTIKNNVPIIYESYINLMKCDIRLFSNPFDDINNNPFDSTNNNPLLNAALIGNYSLFRYWQAAYPDDYTKENLDMYTNNQLMDYAIEGRNPFLINHLISMSIRHFNLLAKIDDADLTKQFGGYLLNKNIYLILLRLHKDRSSYISYLVADILTHIQPYLFSTK
jgi:hypothetical protein